jgi:hypothetical protein
MGVQYFGGHKPAVLSCVWGGEEGDPWPMIFGADQMGMYICTVGPSDSVTVGASLSKRGGVASRGGQSHKPEAEDNKEWGEDPHVSIHVHVGPR